MVRAAIVKIVTSAITSLLTEKFLINMTVRVLGWLAKRTENDLDDKLVRDLKKALDKQYGSEVNLYDQFRG